MRFMFSGAVSFSHDLSRWDVSSVMDMGYMFMGASAMDSQLGGAWSTSAATKTMMMMDCPGGIAGKIKDAACNIV